MSQATEKKRLLLLLIVSALTGIYFLVFYWLIAALFSPMLFAGGDDPWTLFLVFTAMSMPFLIIIFQIVQVVAYLRNRQNIQITAALFLLLSPLLLLFYH